MYILVPSAVSSGTSQVDNFYGNPKPTLILGFPNPKVGLYKPIICNCVQTYSATFQYLMVLSLLDVTKMPSEAPVICNCTHSTLGEFKVMDPAGSRGRVV